MKIINFKKRSVKLWAKEQQDSYENVKICYICKEKFENKYLENEKHRKVTNHVVDNNFLSCLPMYHTTGLSLSKLSRMLSVTKQLGKNLNNLWLWSRALSHISNDEQISMYMAPLKHFVFFFTHCLGHILIRNKYTDISQ